MEELFSFIDIFSSLSILEATVKAAIKGQIQVDGYVNLHTYEVVDKSVSRGIRQTCEKVTNQIRRSNRMCSYLKNSLVFGEIFQDVNTNQAHLECLSAWVCY